MSPGKSGPNQPNCYTNRACSVVAAAAAVGGLAGTVLMQKTALLGGSDLGFLRSHTAPRGSAGHFMWDLRHSREAS